MPTKSSNTQPKYASLSFTGPSQGRGNACWASRRVLASWTGLGLALRPSAILVTGWEWGRAQPSLRGDGVRSWLGIVNCGDWSRTRDGFLGCGHTFAPDTPGRAGLESGCKQKPKPSPKCAPSLVLKPEPGHVFRVGWPGQAAHAHV